MELMELLSGGMRDEGAPLDEPTARQLLRDAFAKLNEAPELKAGQIVRLKRGCEAGYRDFRGGVAMFIGFLTPESKAWAEARLERHPGGVQLAVIDMDCIIGRLSPDGAMSEHFALSRYLEPAE